MSCQSNKHAKELLLTAMISTLYDSPIELGITSMQKFPFDEDFSEEKLYIVSDNKIVKTYFANENFQCQLMTKTKNILEIGTILNL